MRNYIKFQRTALNGIMSLHFRSTAEIRSGIRGCFDIPVPLTARAVFSYGDSVLPCTEFRADRRRIGVEPLKRKCPALVGLDGVDAAEVVGG